MIKSSPIIEFANILKLTGVGSRASNDFKQSQASDKVFLERASVLERLFESEERVLAALHAGPETTASKPTRSGQAKKRTAANLE